MMRTEQMVIPEVLAVDEEEALTILAQRLHASMNTEEVIPSRAKCDPRVCF